MSTFLTILFPFTNTTQIGLLAEDETLMIAEDPDTYRLYYARIPEEYAQPGEALPSEDARPVSELSLDLQKAIVAERETMSAEHLAYLREGMVIPG